MACLGKSHTQSKTGSSEDDAVDAAILHICQHGKVPLLKWLIWWLSWRNQLKYCSISIQYIFFLPFQTLVLSGYYLSGWKEIFTALVQNSLAPWGNPSCRPEWGRVSFPGSSHEIWTIMGCYVYMCTDKVLLNPLVCNFHGKLKAKLMKLRFKGVENVLGLF